MLEQRSSYLHSFLKVFGSKGLVAFSLESFSHGAIPSVGSVLTTSMSNLLSEFLG
jgi:hypothetical protein